jgi:hypothetical protein
VVYRQLVADAAARTGIDDNAGPGGHSGATVSSSATDLTPDIGPSDQPQPGPAPTTLTTPRATGKTTGLADSRPIATTRRRGQRGAPHRTNDVDTDQRRRTLDGLPDRCPLTPAVLEGSHMRTYSVQAAAASPSFREEVTGGWVGR